jgi:hypothetical protein
LFEFITVGGGGLVVVPVADVVVVLPELVVVGRVLLVVDDDDVVLGAEWVVDVPLDPQPARMTTAPAAMTPRTAIDTRRAGPRRGRCDGPITAHSVSSPAAPVIGRRTASPLPPTT